MRKIALALVLILPLAGCTSVASLVSSTAASMSSTTPTEVRTLAEAEQAATLVTKAVDLYVRTGHPSRATLLELKALSDGVHAAIVELDQAQKNGKSLTYDSVNAALLAFSAYSTAKGIKH